MSYNYLDEIRKSIKLLRGEKLEDVASTLQEIVDTTFPGTELIMAVRFNLEKIPKEKLSIGTQKHIETVTEPLGKLLS